MSIRQFLLCILTSLVAVSALAAPPPAGATGATVDFQRDVRPILSDNCFLCHGPDERTRQGGLRLDTRDGAFSHRESGTAVVPGDSEASLLYQRVSHENQGLRMPPFYEEQLTDEQVDVLRRWIDEGASWDMHWSFQALEKPELPEVQARQWVRNPIDRFVLARLEAEGMQPEPEAERSALARRVALRAP